MHPAVLKSRVVALARLVSVSGSFVAVWLASVLLPAAAYAHGGPPAALGIVAASDAGPNVVLLNEGLAVLRDGRWSFVCPRMWGDADVSSGKEPLALSLDGSQTWIAGADDLYAAEGGRLSAQNRPELSSSYVTALARSGETLYGLRITEAGGSEIVRIGSTPQPPLWSSASYFSSLATDGEHLYLGRVVTDLEVEVVTLDGTGQILQQSRTVTDLPTARVELQPTPAGLFAVTFDGLNSSLHRLEGETWRRVQALEGVVIGPQASPGGELWLVSNGVLMHENAGTFEAAPEARRVTCVGSWAGKPYACADSELYWLTDRGLGDRCFDLEGFYGPDPAAVPPSAARECDFQWTLFRNDLKLAGHTPKEWTPAESPTAPPVGAGGPNAAAGTGATTGMAVAGAAGMPLAADGGGAAGAGAAGSNDGCSCAVPASRDTSSWMFAAWCFGWLAVARLRGRARLAAALVWLTPLALELAGGSATLVAGQSLPALRADQPAAERRALAVATYHGGEVTVGELEDAIAASSPLAQEDALEPDKLRALLARSLQFELMAIEAERRGYAEREAVKHAIKQNAVHGLLASEVDAKLPAEKQAFERATPSPERDALIEGLIAELRKTEPQVLHAELLSEIELEDDSEAAAAPK